MYTKYKFKRDNILVPIFNVITAGVIIFFGLVWVFFTGLNSLLDTILAVITPTFMLIGITALLSQLLITNRLYYVKLTDSRVIIFRAIPKTVKYSDIKKIIFSEQMLKGIDSGSEMPLAIGLNVVKSEEFIKEFSEKYKAYTGKDLEIHNDFL